MIQKQCTVFLVDDHPIVRQGLVLMINRDPGFFVCGEADEAHPALDAIAALKPDIVVVDISLNGLNGLEVLRSIRQAGLQTKVLMLSMHDERVYAERALRAGACGYIMKQEATDKILLALHRVMSGEIYVSDRVARTMLKRFSAGPAKLGQSPVETLTDRELEVFRLIGEGHGTRQISVRLRLSVKTVETYQSHIKLKLGLTNARELVQHAVEWAIGENQPAGQSLSAP